MKYKDLQDSMKLYGADQMRFHQKYSSGFGALKAAFSKELKKRSELKTLDQHLTPHDLDTLCGILSQRESRMNLKSVLESYEGEAFEQGVKESDTVKTNAVYRCLYKHLLHTHIHSPAAYQELEKDAIADTLRDRWQHRTESLRFYTKNTDEMARTLLLQDEKIRLTELDVQQGWVSKADFDQQNVIDLPGFKIPIDQEEVEKLIHLHIEIVGKMNHSADASHDEQFAAAILLRDYYHSKNDKPNEDFWYQQAKMIVAASPRQVPNE